MKQRSFIVCLCMLLATTLTAAPRYGRSGVSHWLGLSLTGVEANRLPASSSGIKPKAGYGGQAHLQYEIHKGKFFFNAGLGVDYIVTNNALASYSDAFNRVDFTGEPVIYRYVYSDLKEQERQLRFILPVQFGYEIGEWMYVGVGAEYRAAPFIKSHKTSVQMFSEGEYERFIEPIRNSEQYGYWPESEFEANGPVSATAHELAVEVELGARVPMGKKGLARFGVYAGYDIPVSYSASPASTTPLFDYSAVDTNPATQTWDNTKQNLQINSLIGSPLMRITTQRIRVGVRVSLLINVTHTPSQCMCLRDYY
ncbi:MAG: hypothetical protein IJ554_00300 [Paludibacteraceae bacterium]|nr:hypothetical protein [Paludibacteraceae bacterium]MBR1380898.1 hypothetical protein [Paludibacteraceae bacterium]